MLSNELKHLMVIDTIIILIFAIIMITPGFLAKAIYPELKLSFQKKAKNHRSKNHINILQNLSIGLQTSFMRLKLLHH